MEKFRKTYKVSNSSIPVTEEILNEYKDRVPQLLIDLWKTDGFGKYNGGIIEIVNPKDYESVLWTWLGREVENYIPFAITGFGELFYYRKLTETEEDVCMIDIQYRKIDTIVWSLESFFENFLIDEEDRKLWLREDLFKQALINHGHLTNSEIFTFSPVLAMGGAEELEYLTKGNAQVYQDIVFQMTM